MLAALGAPGAGRPQPNVVDCTIEPYRAVELRWPVEGLVQQVSVQRGDRVRAGQVLAVLESNAERSALELAQQRAAMSARIEMLQHRRDQAGRKAERLAGLQRQAYASTQALEDAEAERRIADAEWRDAIESRELARSEARHAEDLLARRMLTAPFDGVIVERYANPGDLAEGGGRKPALRLAQIEPLRVEAVLPLSLLGSVRSGIPATVTAEGQSERLPARVTVIDPIVDAASGTFGVRLSLVGARPGLVPGIRCRLELPAVTGRSSAMSPDHRVKP